MLRTIERGIEGGKWFALIDKVYRIANLQSAFNQVWRNGGSAGVDGQSVKHIMEPLWDKNGAIILTHMAGWRTATRRFDSSPPQTSY